ncbi:MAG: hypothetical protein V4492_05915 [Chlamydiota bacterium]
MKKICLAACLAVSGLHAASASFDHSNEIAEKGIFEPTPSGTLPGETDSAGKPVPKAGDATPSGKTDSTPVAPKMDGKKTPSNKSVPATPHAEKGIFEPESD